MTPFLRYLPAMALAVTALPAQAAVFTNQADFISAIGTFTLDDFQSGPVGLVPTPLPNTASYDFGAYAVDLSGTAFASGFFGVKPGLYGVGNVVSAYIGMATVTFTFDAPISAFGLSVYDLGTSGTNSISFALDGGPAFEVLPTTSAGIRGLQQFAGVTGTAFTTITIIGTGTDDLAEFDNLIYAGAVPEPATWAMMIMGLGLAGASLRRRPSRIAFG